MSAGSLLPRVGPSALGCLLAVSVAACNGQEEGSGRLPGTGADAGAGGGGSGGANGAGGDPVRPGGASSRDAGPDGSGACVADVVPAEPATSPSFVEPLAFFVAVDRSSSMAGSWGAVGGAVQAFLEKSLDRRFHLSLGFFPVLDRSCLTPGGCIDFVEPDHCGAAGCRGAPGDGATGFLEARLATAAVDGAFAVGAPAASAVQPRPLECGLRAVVNGCDPATAPGGQKCVPVLITSGGATACEGDASALSALVSVGDPTRPTPFVIALPGAAADLAFLESLGNATVVDLTASGDVASIASALETIRDRFTVPRVVPCEWSLPSLPGGEASPPDRVNLQYWEFDYLMGVGRVDTRADCDGVIRGWYYDDPAAPTTLRGCPDTCDSIGALPVEIHLGCPTYPDTRCVGDTCGPADTVLPLPPDSCGPAPGVGGSGAPPPVAAPSCAGLPNDCGPRADESCCASGLVSGGKFHRGYDGVTLSPADYTSLAHVATVSDFHLDRFEVTAGRFRKFRAAWDGGWRPVAGAGKHTHLNGGRGLVNALCPEQHEGGWDPEWTASVQPTDEHLACGLGGYTTWTPSPGANERRPIACANWYEAAAFCIWDGGFLPAEAEWNYAAAGGIEQRVFPWSSPPSATAIDCTHANFSNCEVPQFGSTSDVGSRSPKGDGRYGQADLAGNLTEWTLDAFTDPYPAACTDCTYFPRGAGSRITRGGSYSTSACAPSDCAPWLLSSAREVRSPGNGNYSESWGRTSTLQHVGFRCARAP